MNAPLPRTMAWLLALALLAMPSYALLMGHFGAQRWPIRQLILHAEFQRVSATQIERAVAPQLAAGFFAVDLSAMRERLEGIPWVAAVELRKRWPDAIEISIREHRAVARVGAGRLLAEDGSLFSTPVAAEAMDLPLLSADERHLPELYETLRFAERLFGGPGSVREVALEVHGGMRLVLADGFRITLGRNAPRQRLARFAALRERLSAHPLGPFEAADLRYSHGFALRRASPAAAKEES
ncbi:MAG: cell division protein FtsQ [Lysobacterales bacterium]|jgi:cell division protein FtsQ|nr:MAG: cell division protein FtsQ [Xanthomonadales bacterium]